MTTTTELIKDLPYAELKKLAEEAAARADSLRDSELSETVAKFEALAQQRFGMTVKQLMAASRKQKKTRPRGRPRIVEAATDQAGE